MSYINNLKKVYNIIIDDIYNLYEEYKFNNSSLTFNELLIQFHFNQIKETTQLTAVKMMEGLPRQYHWIVKNILKYEVKKQINVKWGAIKNELKDTLKHNMKNQKEIESYQQFHAPLRCL